MAQPDWEALAAEVQSLAHRVAELERYTGMVGATRGAAAPAAPAAEGGAPRTDSAVIVAIAGRALLGLAGAYLLRAITESGAIPIQAGVAAGILYALAWLAWASRTSPERRLEAAVHSLTAALVLAPLLWEAALHFHAIGTWTAAAVLLLFTVAGMAAAWRKNLVTVSTIATLAGLGAAAALLMATHDVLPFTFLFLAIAETVEISACLEHWLNERWLAAIAADLSVLLATWLVTNERGLPEVYAPIPHIWLLGAQVLLLAVYLSSTIVRTLVCGFTFTGFEIAQCAAAFAIGVTGGLRLSAADRHAAPAMALLMLLCAVACYLVSFAVLERRASRGRNFYVYSTFGLLLALAGTRLLLTGNANAAVWTGLALLCLWLGASASSLTLRIHGAIYLLLAVAWIGALQQSASLLLGNALWPIPRPAALWLATGAAAIACALGNAAALPVRLVLNGTFCWLSAGIAAGLLGAAGHAYSATLRTGVLSLASIGLAWCGARWLRRDFSYLAWISMALGAYRLVFEDLHQERKVALFLSLLLYGSALILLPKLKNPRSLSEAEVFSSKLEARGS